MESKKRISVIVPVYNAVNLLPGCMESLLRQTWQNLEIILVDDGSTDGSGALCDEYADSADTSDSADSADSADRADRPKVRVIHQANAGVCAARNRGMEEATGDYIGFCDNDDTVHPCFFERLMEWMDSEKAQIAVCGYARTASQTEALQEPGEEKELKVYGPDEAFGCLVRGEYPLKSYLWNKLYERRLLDGIYFPEDRIIEDQFVTWQLLLKAERIVVSDWQGYGYYSNPESITNRRWKRRDLDYVDAWIRIRDHCAEHFPEYEEEAAAQVVSAAVYTWSRMRKAGADDADAENRLREIILRYSDGYVRSNLYTATLKRKLVVSFLRAKSRLAGGRAGRRTGGEERL